MKLTYDKADKITEAIMSTMTNSLITNKNRELWELLSSNFNITIVEKSNVDYSVFSQGKDVEITVDSNNLCASSFTHELLHINMRYYECYIGASLKSTINSDEKLADLMSAELLEHISNCLDHFKFLPTYLCLGFNSVDFISDYETNKCTKKQLNAITKTYKIAHKINSHAVDPFIGILVAMITDPNPKFNYSKKFEQFEKIDSKLYNCVLNLFKDWEKVKIESSDIFENDYHEVVHLFRDALEEWYESSSFH